MLPSDAFKHRAKRETADVKAAWTGVKSLVGKQILDEQLEFRAVRTENIHHLTLLVRERADRFLGK